MNKLFTTLILINLSVGTAICEPELWKKGAIEGGKYGALSSFIVSSPYALSIIPAAIISRGKIFTKQSNIITERIGVTTLTTLSGTLLGAGAGATATFKSKEADTTKVMAKAQVAGTFAGTTVGFSMWTFKIVGVFAETMAGFFSR